MYPISRGLFIKKEGATQFVVVLAFLWTPLLDVTS